MTRVLFSIAIATLALAGTANAQEVEGPVNRIDLGTSSYDYGEDYPSISPSYEETDWTESFLSTQGSETVLRVPVRLTGDLSIVLMEVEVEWPIEYARRPPGYRGEDFYAVALFIPLGVQRDD